MIFAFYNGELVQASHQLPDKAVYICPSKYCSNKQLILKKGRIKIPHFAHKVRSTCNDYTEPETQAHIAMKLSFQQTLDIPEEMIEYGKIKGVRPDLLWRKEYALEVQHSPIRAEEIIRRNQIYEKNNLIPVWIFHQSEGMFAFFEDGYFGQYHDLVVAKRYRKYNILRLKEAEKIIAEKHGGLFYMLFSTDNMTSKDHKNKYSLRFDHKSGPWLFNRRIKKIAGRSSFYIVTEKFQIDSNQKFIDLL